MNILKSLFLRNFRNFSESEIHFSEGLNVICGNNAQGKTNLLEAICFIATGRSHRCQRLSELIRAGETFFYLEAEILQNQVSQWVKVFFNGHDKRLQLNSSTYASFHPLLGILPLVFHTPSDSELVTGSPQLRRRFLNLHLAQSDPVYVHHLSRFWRAMKQRNCLLRRRNDETIRCFESEMAISASYLYKMRHAFIEDLKPLLSDDSKSLTSDNEIHELRYHPSPSGNYLQQLEKSRLRDLELGMTSSGPHRDELSFWIDGKAARLFASEGQKKTAIAALRLAEWNRMARQLSCKPLMAVDELGLSLDETRLSHVQGRLKKLGQVFITTPSLLPGMEEGRKIHIQNGSATWTG